MSALLCHRWGFITSSSISIYDKTTRANFKSESEGVIVFVLTVEFVSLDDPSLIG